jgi:PEP-CTERM motif-containing protein
MVFSGFLRILRPLLPAGLLMLPMALASNAADARIIRSTGLTSGVPNCPGWGPSQDVGVFQAAGQGVLLGETTPYAYSISGVDDGNGTFIQHGCISGTDPDFYEFDQGELLDFTANYTGPGGTYDDNSALWNYVTTEFEWVLTDENDHSMSWTFKSTGNDNVLTGSGLPGPGEYNLTVALTLIADTGYVIATQQRGTSTPAPWVNTLCVNTATSNYGCPTWTSIVSPETKVWIYNVPEPNAWPLMLLGFTGLAFSARFRRAPEKR